MAVTKLYLIRHAEAEGNLDRRLHGWYDSLITERGYRQIAALEERFREINIDAVYSSDLFRTCTTASAVYKPKGLQLNKLRDLREIHVGDWEDESFADVIRRYPVQFNLFNNNQPDFAFSGSETFAQVRERVVQAIFKIVEKHCGETVAIFSHGVAIRNALGYFLGYELEDIHQKIPHGDNTAVAYLEFEDGVANVVFYNDNSHLSEELSTFAGQHWWKKQGKAIDYNLWFRPLDMETEEGRALFYQAREEAWLTIHGSMLHFNGEGFLADAIEQSRRDKRSVIQVMYGDHHAGVLHLNLQRDADKGVGNIPFFYMDPEYRRRGLGVQLLGQATSVFRPLGRKYLRLRCAPDNEVAQRFYKRYGFKKIGEDPGSRVPLDIMEKYIGYND